MLAKHEWGRHPAGVLGRQGRWAGGQQAQLLGGRGTLGGHHGGLQQAVQHLLLLLLLLTEHGRCGGHGVVPSGQQVCGGRAQGLVVVGPQGRRLQAAGGDGAHAGQDLHQHVLALRLLMLVGGMLGDHGGSRGAFGPQEVRQQALLLKQGVSATHPSHAVLLLLVVMVLVDG